MSEYDTVAPRGRRSCSVQSHWPCSPFWILEVASLCFCCLMSGYSFSGNVGTKNNQLLTSWFWYCLLYPFVERNVACDAIHSLSRSLRSGILFNSPARKFLVVSSQHCLSVDFFSVGDVPYFRLRTAHSMYASLLVVL